MPSRASVKPVVRLAAALLLGAPALCPLPAHADSSAADWPQLSRDSYHTSLARDAAMTQSAATHLGVRWMTNMYGASLGSPVVAFGSALNAPIVYIGDQRGDVLAYDATTGRPVWSTSAGYGTDIVTTPLVSGGAVWAGTDYGSTLYKLDATTGAVDCSMKMKAPFEASPTAATVGGTATVFASTIDLFSTAGPILAVNAANCATIFSFYGYLNLTGVWASPAFAVDALGRPLVIAGSADPDSTEYAIDAATGQRVWDYRIYNPPPGAYDIGSGATIAPPGTDGFADGAVFFPTKYGIMYALDLTTGAPIWQFDFNAAAGASEGGISDPALVRNTLVFGFTGGVYAIDATTGAPIWQYRTPSGTEVVSAPAVAGPEGKEVVAFADLAGVFHVLRLRDGASLYSYQTGGYITSSVAESRGQFYVASSDGFLYDFGPGGGNAPTGVSTTIASPASGTQVPNAGRIRISGTAASSAILAGVRVAVQSGGPAGPFYDAATHAWSSGAIGNRVAVTQPGPGSAAWHFDLPLPPGGGTYQVYASAIDATNLADRKGASSSFRVSAPATAASIAVSSTYVAPATSFTVTGAGFQPSETVTIGIQNATLATTAADANGNLVPATVALASAAPFGIAEVIAVGASSGTTAQTPIDITNAWTQSGYGPTHASYEPNDDLLDQLIHPGAGLFLGRAWYYSSGAPVRSSPAVVDGVAYFGNDAGTLSAVNVATGVPLWSVKTPAKAPIRSTPAVDSGLVSVTDDANHLYEFSAATGALAGSIALGGRMTSPTVANQTVYAGLATGKVIAFNESTGAIRWASPTTGPVEDAPAVDPAAGIAIAGDDAGNVIALDAATGRTRWSFHTSAAVVASPAVYRGAVYAGSTDGTLYVLNETTGAVLWTYAIGTPIRATPAIGPAPKFYLGDAVYVGGSGGTLVALNTSGARVWTVPFRNPIVGVSASFDTVFVETAQGIVSATRGPGDGLDFWSYKTNATLATTAAVVNGAVYVGAADGGLYAFTPYGRAPFALRTQRR